MTDQPGPDAATAPVATPTPPSSPTAPVSPPPSPSAADRPAPAGEPDWTDQVTDLIVDSVDKVRSRTTGPILDVAKGSVYALVALIILIPVAVLALAGAVRLLNWALPGDVWVAYTVMGCIFVLLGVVLWAKRQPRPTP